MEDHFGFITYGPDRLYHLGALFSALRLLHWAPGAKISVLTDHPRIFDGYPVDVLELTERDKTEMSFGGRYHFGIKAAGVIALLKRCRRLLFMDTDIYPTGSIADAFERISPAHSLMRLCEGAPPSCYASLAGAGISIGGERVTGEEPMWNSGIIGVHGANLALLEDAYAALPPVVDAVDAHTPEQFCVGTALSRGGRTVSPHRLALRHYSTSGKKRFARSRIEAFFAGSGHQNLDDRIRRASTIRLSRTPLDLLAGRRRLQ